MQMIFVELLAAFFVVRVIGLTLVLLATPFNIMQLPNSFVYAVT